MGATIAGGQDESRTIWDAGKIAEFYGRFRKDLEHAQRHMTDIKRMEEPTGENCEKCGKPMVIKWGRFGKFYACSGYPDCKTTKRIGGEQKKTDVPLEEKCPQCGSNLDCDFVAWRTPLAEKCPECGSSYLLEKWLKAGPVAQCPNAECKYKRELPKVEQTA